MLLCGIKVVMFDKTLHHPERVKIVSMLLTKEYSSFLEIKKELTLSDGALATHTKNLDKAGYIKIEKFFENNKPKTSYTLTQYGKDSFIQYLRSLQNFLDDEQMKNILKENK